MRRFKNFEGFSIFFKGLVSALDFLNHSPRLLLDASNVLSTVELYDKICIDPITIHILLSANFCAYVDCIEFYDIERFKKSGCSVIRVTVSPNFIIVKTI